MSNYKLCDPHIEVVSVNGKEQECLMSMARNTNYFMERVFVELTDRDLIERLRSYIEKTKGGIAEVKVDLPKELSILAGYKCVEYDLNGVYVKRYNDFRFVHQCLITEENGIEYLEAVPTPETGIWYIDQKQDPISFLDNMEPIKYSKIHFLCKYDYHNNTYAEGWNPNVVGERIKEMFFIKYAPERFQT